MNEPVSSQRRRPPGWRAARRPSDDGDQPGPTTRPTPPTPPTPPGPRDEAFGRGETVERPAVRLPVDDTADDDHPVFGARRDGDRQDRDDRTRTMSAVESERYRADPVEDRLRIRGRRRDDDDVPDDEVEDLEDDEYGDVDDGAHPVAVPLAGFFAGMVYILVLPVLYVWLSNPDNITDVIGVDLVWLLVAVLVPVFLTAIPQTRTFGRYMLLGVGLSAVVVIGVAAIVLAVLIFLV